MAEPDQTGERILDFLGIERPASRSHLHEALERVQPGTVGNWQTELTCRGPGGHRGRLR